MLYQFVTKELKSCEENWSIMRPPGSKEKQCEEAKEERANRRQEWKRGAREIANSRVNRLRAREVKGRWGEGENAGRNREIGSSRENNDFSFVMRSACVKVRRAGFSRRDSSSGPAWLVDIFFSRRASKIDILCRSRGKGSTPSSPVAILALANKNSLNRRTSGRTRAKE